VSGCGGSAKRQDIAAADFRFDPGERHVSAGATVTWNNTGSTAHTVKGRDFFSKAIEPGESYEHRFDKPGTYRYVCTLHPQSMRATVVVDSKSEQ
jgi:plastocyanin